MVLHILEIPPKVTKIVTLSGGRGVQERPPCHSLKMSLLGWGGGVKGKSDNDVFFLKASLTEVEMALFIFFLQMATLRRLAILKRLNFQIEPLYAVIQNNKCSRQRHILRFCLKQRHRHRMLLKPLSHRCFSLGPPSMGSTQHTVCKCRCIAQAHTLIAVLGTSDAMATRFHRGLSLISCFQTHQVLNATQPKPKKTNQRDHIVIFETKIISIIKQSFQMVTVKKISPQIITSINDLRFLSINFNSPNTHYCPPPLL